MENGAGLCSAHHLNAEQILISTTDLYKFCDTIRALPKHLDPSFEYDTWGNIVNLDGYSCVPGELFEDEGAESVSCRACFMDVSMR